MKSAQALYVVAADPAGDDPSMAEAGKFLVVQDLFLTDTAKLADVVLPVEAYTEREGSFTSGERRVQRFYPAVPEPTGLKSDFAVTGQIGQLLGFDLEARIASKVMLRIAAKIADYAGLDYIKLAEVIEQWPIVGRGDVYYGGTSYENSQGLGVQLAPAAQRGAAVPLAWPQLPQEQAAPGSLLAVPVNRLLDRGQTIWPSTLLHPRIPQPYVALNPADAAVLRIPSGTMLQVTLNGTARLAAAHLDENAPQGVLLVPRSMGLPIFGPAPVEIHRAEVVPA
jgi:NADH-quinone oxidoreductase subunit G